MNQFRATPFLGTNTERLANPASSYPMFTLFMETDTSEMYLMHQDSWVQVAGGGGGGGSSDPLTLTGGAGASAIPLTIEDESSNTVMQLARDSSDNTSLDATQSIRLTAGSASESKLTDLLFALGYVDSTEDEYDFRAYVSGGVVVGYGGANDPGDPGTGRLGVYRDTAAPAIVLRRHDNTLAATAEVMSIEAHGPSGAGTSREYSSITTVVDDATDGAEESSILISTMVAGAEIGVVRLGEKIGFFNESPEVDVHVNGSGIRVDRPDAAPFIQLRHVEDAGTISNGDYIGTISLQGPNSLSTALNYVMLRGEAEDINASDEYGRLQVRAVVAGSLTEVMLLGSVARFGNAYSGAGNALLGGLFATSASIEDYVTVGQSYGQAADDFVSYNFGVNDASQPYVGLFAERTGTNINVGHYTFVAYNENNTPTRLVRLTGRLVDNTDGSEDGRFTILTTVGGTETAQAAFQDGIIVGAATGGMPGNGKINATDYEVNGVSIDSTSWTTISSYLNGWGAYSTSTVRYTKTVDGTVHVMGLISGGTIGQDAFQLPSGYRPSGANVNFAPPCASAGYGTRVRVDTSGNVRVIQGSTTWTSVSLSFRV